MISVCEAGEEQAPPADCVEAMISTSKAPADIRRLTTARPTNTYQQRAFSPYRSVLTVRSTVLIFTAGTAFLVAANPW
jgi:hypothetical protein